MSGVFQAVDPKTAQRLRARRIIVIDADAARARAFAQALQQSGAAVATISPADMDYHAAHALDADVLLVNEDEPEPCRALVLALRQHPRTRWSTVLPVSFAAFWPSEAEQPDVASIADQVTGFATALIELTVRAKGKLPYDMLLEPLGPSRSLRALGSTDRSLHITLSDERMRAELELADGKLAGVRAWIEGVPAPLADAEALSAVLAMPSGQLRIDELGEPVLPRWNIELPAALASAAAITQERGLHPTVPQLTFAEILAEAKAKGRARSLPPPADRETIPQPAPIAEPAFARAQAIDSSTHETYEPAIVERRSPGAKPRRVPVRTLAMAFALLGASALAFSLQARGGRYEAPRVRSERSAASYSGSLATVLAQPQPRPPVLAGAAPARVELETAAEAALDEPGEVAPAPREPSRSELQQAKRIVKRAHHYLRAKRYATAAAAFAKALELDSSHVIATRALVRIHLREQNSEDALRWAERLAELEPDSNVSQLLLGDAHALSGDAALAEQAWQRASALGSEAAGKRVRPN